MLSYIHFTVINTIAIMLGFRNPQNQILLNIRPMETNVFFLNTGSFYRHLANYIDPIKRYLRKSWIKITRGIVYIWVSPTPIRERELWSAVGTFFLNMCSFNSFILTLGVYINSMLVILVGFLFRWSATGVLVKEYRNILFPWFREVS